MEQVSISMGPSTRNDHKSYIIWLRLEITVWAKRIDEEESKCYQNDFPSRDHVDVWKDAREEVKDDGDNSLFECLLRIQRRREIDTFGATRSMRDKFSLHDYHCIQVRMDELNVCAVTGKGSCLSTDDFYSKCMEKLVSKSWWIEFYSPTWDTNIFSSTIID